MKRTHSCSLLFEPNSQCKKIGDLEENEDNLDSLTSSVIVSDECDSESLSSSNLDIFSKILFLYEDFLLCISVIFFKLKTLLSFIQEKVSFSL